MRRCGKIALGIATFWPIAVVLTGSAIGYRTHLTLERDPAAKLQPLPLFLAPTVLLTVLLTGTLAWALLLFYMRHISGNEAIPRDRRRFWMTIVFVGNMVTMPVYWCL